MDDDDKGERGHYVFSDHDKEKLYRAVRILTDNPEDVRHNKGCPLALLSLLLKVTIITLPLKGS